MKRILLILTMLLLFPITVFARDVDWDRIGVRFIKPGPIDEIEIINDNLYYFDGDKVYMFDKKADNLIKSIEIEHKDHFVINNIIYLINYKTELVDSSSNYRKSTMYFTTLNSNLEKINNSSLLYDYRNSSSRISTYTFIKNDKLQLFTINDDVLTFNSDGTITNHLGESNGNYAFGQTYFKTDGTTRYINLNGVSKLYKFQDGFVTYSNNTGSSQNPSGIADFYLFKLGEEATFNFSDRILLAKTTGFNVANLFYAENMDLYANISGQSYKINDDYTLATEPSEVKPLLPNHDYRGIITLGDEYCREQAMLPSCYTIDGIDRNEKSLYLVSETNQSDTRYILIYKNGNNVKTKRINVNNSVLTAAVGYFKDYIIVAYKVSDKNYISFYDQNLNLVKDNIEIKDVTGEPSDIAQSEQGLYVAYKVRNASIENMSNQEQNGNLAQGVARSESPKAIQLFDQHFEYLSPYTTVYLSDVYFVDTITDGNGTVTIAKDNYDANEQVTFVVTPKKGYVLGSVKVTDANGNVIIFKDYTFTMPSADVTIDATFVKAEEKVNPNTKDSIIIVIALLVVALITTLILKRQKKLIN